MPYCQSSIVEVTPVLEVSAVGNPVVGVPVVEVFGSTQKTLKEKKMRIYLKVDSFNFSSNKFINWLGKWLNEQKVSFEPFLLVRIY